MEDVAKSQKKEPMKTAAKRSAKLIKPHRMREALTGTEEMARLIEVTGLSENSIKSILSPAANTPSSVREILANCGHPIEEIIRKVLIPKLHAKEIQVIKNRGKVETRVVDDHDIQLKTAIELAKMCGCDAANKGDARVGDCKPTATLGFDMDGATNDELVSMIRIVCKIRERNSAGQGRILQSKPSDVALER
jgi:hypothetical protein